MRNFRIHIILVLVFVVGSTQITFGQIIDKMNVAMSKPKMKATETYTKGNVYLEHVMAEAISESTDLVHFIDRSEMELINKHREGGYKKLEGNQGSAQLEGVEYILESKVLNFSESWSKHCDVVKEEFMEKGKKVTKTMVDSCRHSSILVKFDMEVELISVETGEIVSKRNIKPSAWSYESFIPNPTDEDKTRMRVKAYNEMRDCFNVIWRNNLLKILQPEIAVIDIPEERKGKAQKIYINGGDYANYPAETTFELVKKYAEKIGDETILREEKIGEVQLEEKFYSYSICDVKKGKEEIFSAFNNGDELYCKPGLMLKLEECGKPAYRYQKMKAIKSTNKLITIEDKQKEAEKKDTKTKTTTTPKPKEIQINARNPSSSTKKGGGN